MTRPSATARSAADWEAIHRDYRVGILTLREIGAAYHVSHTAIRKRAVRDGWERDLAVRIRARAEALVSKAEVSSEVSTESRVSDDAIVEANAQMITEVRLRHRAMIEGGRILTMRLLDDLRAGGENLPLLERLVVAVAKDAAVDEKEIERRVASMRRAFDLCARACMMKTLVDSLAKFLTLEREAYGFDIGSGSNKRGLSDQLAELLRKKTWWEQHRWRHPVV